MLLKPLLAVALAVAVAACGDPPGPCLGDCKAALTIAPTGLRDGNVVDATDGVVVDIQPPDQGGFVIYVGVRAQNVHARGGSLSAALRDVAGGAVVALEERPVQFVLRGDGWAVPESGYQDQANLPVCGLVPGPVDFDARSWRLELTLRDSDGRTATAATSINPRCAGWAASDCMCSCQAGAGPCVIDDGDAGIAIDAGADGA